MGTTTVGTEISDLMDRTLNLGYAEGSLFLSTCLLAALAVWYARERNLSVYPIFERRSEIFYWVAVLLSNSLGAAFGDFLSDDMRLSYLSGAFVTAGIIAVVIGLHYSTRFNETALFWIAFVFTRPFGATFGDFPTKPIAKGGLDLGTLPASTVTLSLLALVLVYATWRQRSRQVEALNRVRID